MFQGNTDYVTNVEYNYVHDFGVGVTNDFGGIKTGNKHYCDNEDEAGLEERCYSYTLQRPGAGRLALPLLR